MELCDREPCHATFLSCCRREICYHVLNRGNARAEVFHKDGDYDAFVRIIGESQEPCFTG